MVCFHGMRPFRKVERPPMEQTPPEFCVSQKNIENNV